MFLPKAKTENIVVQKAGNEVLIYDLMANKVFCLNETSTKVYQACNGKTSFDELKTKFKLTDDLIYFALHEFHNLDLVSSDYQSKFASIPRRELIKKVGLASAMALPLVTSIVAPQAVHAQSNCLNPGGAAAEVTVSVQITNPFNITDDNQNFAGGLLVAQCCNNAYRDFVSNGCSNGIGGTCNAEAVCL